MRIVEDSKIYEDEVDKVIKGAFDQDDEANLVKQVRDNAQDYISLVAINEANDDIMGHILVSPIKLGNIDILSLAPVSVCEKYQNQGVGGKLIRSAISKAKKLEDKYPLLCVLGSDHYYKRFGFESHNPKKIKLPYDVEPRFFQLLELKPGSLKEASGDIVYPDYFM